MSATERPGTAGEGERDLFIELETLLSDTETYLDKGDVKIEDLVLVYLRMGVYFSALKKAKITIPPMFRPVMDKIKQKAIEIGTTGNNIKEIALNVGKEANLSEIDPTKDDERLLGIILSKIPQATTPAPEKAPETVTKIEDDLSDLDLGQYIKEPKLVRDLTSEKLAEITTRLVPYVQKHGDKQPEKKAVMVSLVREIGRRRDETASREGSRIRSELKMIESATIDSLLSDEETIKDEGVHGDLIQAKDLVEELSDPTGRRKEIIRADLSDIRDHYRQKRTTLTKAMFSAISKAIAVVENEIAEDIKLGIEDTSQLDRDILERAVIEEGKETAAAVRLAETKRKLKEYQRKIKEEGLRRDPVAIATPAANTPLSSPPRAVDTGDKKEAEKPKQVSWWRRAVAAGLALLPMSDTGINPQTKLQSGFKNRQPIEAGPVAGSNVATVTGNGERSRTTAQAPITKEVPDPVSKAKDLLPVNKDSGIERLGRGDSVYRATKRLFGGANERMTKAWANPDSVYKLPDGRSVHISMLDVTHPGDTVCIEKYGKNKEVRVVFKNESGYEPSVNELEVTAQDAVDLKFDEIDKESNPFTRGQGR